MNKRLGVTFVFLIVIVAGTAMADKKSTAIVRISRVEGTPAEVLLNPAEFTIDKSVPWQKAKDSSSEDPVLEFTSPDSKSLSCELAFDTFETKENVYDKYVRALENLTLVDQDLKRPPMVKVIWGASSLPSFAGVVESLNVRYTLFLPDGTPCRATVTLRMRSASAARTRQGAPCP